MYFVACSSRSSHYFCYLGAIMKTIIFIILGYIAFLVGPPLVMSFITSFLEWEWIFFWSNEMSREATVYYWFFSHVMAFLIVGNN